MIEEWKGVPGWRAYEVSTAARVQSIDRVVAGKATTDGRISSRFIRGKILTPVIRPDGTACVNLWRADRYIQVPIRRLMLLAFVGPRPRGKDAVNVNRDPTDNRLKNLKWDYVYANGAFQRMIGLA